MLNKPNSYPDECITVIAYYNPMLDHIEAQ